MKTVAKLNSKFYIITALLGIFTFLMWNWVYSINTNEILMADDSPMTAEYKLLFTIGLCLVAVSWTMSLISLIRQCILGYAYTADENGIYNTLTVKVIFALIFIIPVKQIPGCAISKIIDSDTDTFAILNKSKIVVFRPFRFLASKRYYFFKGFTKTNPQEAVALLKK